MSALAWFLLGAATLGAPVGIIAAAMCAAARAGRAKPTADERFDRDTSEAKWAAFSRGVAFGLTLNRSRPTTRVRALGTQADAARISRRGIN